MKAILKNIRKKAQSEQTKQQFERGISPPSSPSGPAGAGSPRSKGGEGDSGKAGHIINMELPRHRQSRAIDPSVICSLPTLRDSSASTRSRLLLKKMRLCSFVFAFSDQPDSPQEAKNKETKRSTLLELVNYLTVFKPAFTEEELEETFEMIMCNLVRPLPPSTLDMMGMYNPEEDEPACESTWPHLQVVYEFLLRLATSTETDSKLLAKYFSRSFVLSLLELFDSEDPRERDYLKTILHRIYGNFMGLRPFIRRAINNVFYKFIYETDRHNGIAELLEILGSIINGFALPIKEQHKQFLSRVLLPLHKASFVSVFHPQLSYCVTQFLEKDASLAPVVVRAILKFWPVTNSKKELMFLTEIEEVLDRVESGNLGDSLVPLFSQIAHSINSPHFQVSERAIYVLNHDVIVRFIQNNRESLVPILSKALFSNTFAQRGENMEYKEQLAWQKVGHWNPTIVELTQDILKLFNEMDATLMQQCESDAVTSVPGFLQAHSDRKDVWAKLQQNQ